MEPVTASPDVDFIDFAKQIKRKTGLDLLSYKQAQVVRRLTSLRNRQGFQSFAEFYRAMERDESVHRAFIDQLTINVTEFFRNPERWHALRDYIAPQIVGRTERIKCWSAACSTGEEPYSLVLTLQQLVPLGQIDVLATDLDATVVERAKQGRYPLQGLAEVPQQMRKQFFEVDDGQYVVTEGVRKRIRFRQHNLLADPFEKGYDLIVCRNVMIYFTEEAKTRLYQKFAESLKPGGFLFVGGTEQITNPQRYGLTSKTMFFYQKSGK